MSPSQCTTDHQPQQPRKYHYGDSHPEHRILPLVGHKSTGNRRLRCQPVAIGEPPCSCPPPWSSVLHTEFFLLLRVSACLSKHTTPWAGLSLWGVTLPRRRADAHMGSGSRQHVLHMDERLPFQMDWPMHRFPTTGTASAIAQCRRAGEPAANGHRPPPSSQDERPSVSSRTTDRAAGQVRRRNIPR